MNYPGAVITIILLFLSVCAQAQTRGKKDYWPLWTYNQKNIRVHGISVGLGFENPEKRASATNGIRMELIGWGVAIPLMSQAPSIVRDSADSAPVSERINGLSLSASGTACECTVNGINVGLIGHINYQVNGVTASAFANAARIHNGVQLALIANNARIHNGIQVAFIANESLQTKGLQIGAFNTTKKLRGVQLGLWNVNDRRKLPLINWNFR
ncbi:LA_2272 family surface repeat-containing protein [Dawidia soli]|uniref:Uncharacterized protein n=1 Tax=Dawidia soli TaxID=2782352 RepID=A0AAP2DB44_9BACT|nr:hypothetical protein [Dawidia soli]MBT1688664.1 hypothetical protein [Dawidia soli]